MLLLPLLCRCVRTVRTQLPTSLVAVAAAVAAAATARL